MADDPSTSQPSERRAGPGRGGRTGAPRGESGRADGPRGEGGGFRIRLSDNEMQAARALQDAFGLRSTVAVLGFALRTLAQQLEQGQLQELVNQHRAQASARPRQGERRPGRGEGGPGGAPGGRVRVDPFARPSRPAAAEPVVADVDEPAAEAATEEGATEEAASADDVAIAASADATSGESLRGDSSGEGAGDSPVAPSQA